MAKLGFDLKGFDRLRFALDPKRINARLAPNMRKATGRNALLVVAAIRKEIQGGRFTKNAALTEAVKGSDKPLVDYGQLFQSITHKMESDFEAFAGLLRTDSFYNIGVALHEGATLRVTPRMRSLFFLLWLASKGQATGLDGRAAELFQRYQDWKPISPETSAITIPGRPFIAQALANKDLKAKAHANWARAVTESLKPGGKK